MVLGWRRAFCTSIQGDEEPSIVSKQNQQPNNKNNPIPKLGSKLGFFSNPSTPRFRSHPKTSTPPPNATVPSPSLPQTPKLQCNTTSRKTPLSSPRSPSTFSLLKSTLRLSKSRCGICLENVKTGQGTAILTAECSHSFHFLCIAAQLKRQTILTCPVCNSTWKEMPLLSRHHQKPVIPDENKRDLLTTTEKKITTKCLNNKQYAFKVYNDDEPLMSPTSASRFNPILENEEDELNVTEEFHRFSFKTFSPIVESLVSSRNVELSLLPEAVVVSVGRSRETYATVLKIRAPAAQEMTTTRAPIDLVTVVDVSGRMNTKRIQMMKNAMRLIVSSLNSYDRLSIVGFSLTSKRLLPLTRMTPTGRRSARRIVDAIVALDGTTASATDALKKAAKVIEDRRERNPVTSIMLLSDGQDERSSTIRTIRSSFVSSTRFNHLEIPVHYIGFRASTHSPSEDAFGKYLRGLLSVVVQDLRIRIGFVSGSAPAEISAVYSYAGRPVSLGSSSVRVGDLYPEEERELLVELKVPSSAIWAHHVLSVRCSFRDPTSKELFYGEEQALLVPRPRTVRSSTPNIAQLRCLFLTTRAVAESKRLIDRGDLNGAHHMLGSAKALLVKSSSSWVCEFVRGLEAELAQLNLRRESQCQQIQWRRMNDDREVGCLDEKGEPLTPTSAWRAAERLAKVAIMRKSLNRVSDLHGFENARF